MRWPLIIIGMLLLLCGGTHVTIESFKRSFYETKKHLNNGETLSADELKAVIELQERLSRRGWHDAEALKITALAEYTLALKPSYAKDSSALLANAKRHLAQGLMLSPADPANWLRLAYLRTLTHEPAHEISHALNLSVTTGPRVPYLIAPRLKLALLVWDTLESNTQAVFMSQMALLQRWDPQTTESLASLNDRNQFLFHKATAHKN